MVLFLILIGGLLGGILGAILGFFIPFVLALNYVDNGGDPQAAAAYSFFPIVTVPLGAIFGMLIGVGIGGSLWLKFFKPLADKKKGNKLPNDSNLGD